MTPPGYLIPGTSSGGVKVRSRSNASFRLEYGDPVWMLSEHLNQNGIAVSNHPGEARDLMVRLRRVAKAVSSFLF